MDTVNQVLDSALSPTIPRIKTFYVHKGPRTGWWLLRT